MALRQDVRQYRQALNKISSPNYHLLLWHLWVNMPALV